MKKLILLLSIVFLIGFASADLLGDVAYWNFDENGGTTAADSVASYDLTVENNWDATGTSGSALIASATADDTGISFNGNTSITINQWLYRTGDPTLDGVSTSVFSTRDNGAAANGEFYTSFSNETSVRFTVYVPAGTFVPCGFATLNTWVMFTSVFNGTDIACYRNAELVETTPAAWTPSAETIRFLSNVDGGDSQNFQVDESRIWQRALSRSDILLVLGDGSILNSPADSSTLVQDPVNFNITSISSGTLVNTTLFVWNSTGIFQTNFTTVTGTTNETIFNISNFVAGAYKYNALTCSLTACNYAASNFSFTWGYNITGETFTTPVVEGDTSTFALNLTLASGETISAAKFIYNNTDYGVSINSLGSDKWRLSRDLLIPDVGASQVVNDFNWNFTIGSNQFSSTTQQQTVNTFAISDCSVYDVPLLNLTLREESGLALMDGNGLNGTIEVDLTISTADETQVVAEYSNVSSLTNNAMVCLQNSLGTSEFKMDATVLYKADNHAVEYYNIQGFNLTNSTLDQRINLYDVKTADSQPFIITFKDDSFSPVENALVTITRNYVGEGLFRTVEAPLTDGDGQVTVHLVIQDVIYTIQVSKDGTLLATFDEVTAFCADITIGECEINLDTFGGGTQPTDFTTINDFLYSMSFDQTTRVVTATFTIPSGGVSTIGLSSILYDNRGNSTVCSSELVASSGTLTCTIPVSYGNVTVQAILLKDGSIINSALYTIKQDVSDLFGGTGYIFLLLLYVTLPLMLITTGPGMIIAAILGLIFGALLNMFNTDNIVGVGSTILWFIIAGGIIAWKVAKRE